MRSRKFNIVLFYFVFVFSSTMSGYAQNLDINILKPINHIDAGSGFNNSMLFITHSASYLEIGSIAGMGIIGWLNDDDKMLEFAIIAGAAQVINLAVTSTLKYSIKRPRPMAAYPDLIVNHGLTLTERSFPSGHTCSAFAFATSLTLSYPKWYIAVPVYVRASSVAFSRMYLGVHYPSDILGGMIVGASSAYLTYRVNDWWKNRQKKEGVRKEFFESYYRFE